MTGSGVIEIMHKASKLGKKGKAGSSWWTGSIEGSVLLRATVGVNTVEQ